MARYVAYSAAGATMNATNALSFEYAGGAGEVPSKIAGGEDIRSGSPNTNSTAILVTEVVGEGHYLDSIDLSFKYITGYGPTGNPKGPTLSLLVVDAVTGATVKNVYTSSVLNKYAFGPFKGYSPYVKASLTGQSITHNTNTMPL